MRPARRHIQQQVQFVGIVEVNNGIDLAGPEQVDPPLTGTIKQNVRAGHAVQQGLFQLHAAHHLRPRPLLVEGAAHGIQVVGFIRPGQLHLRVARAEGPRGCLVAAPQLPLAQHKQRRAKAGDQLVYPHPIKVRHGPGTGAGAKLVQRPGIELADSGSFVRKLHEKG